jgi:hypothetical protein
MFTVQPTDKSKYILFRRIKETLFGVRQSFFCIYNKEDKEPTKLASGEEVYEIIGYTETVQEAQMKLHGRVTATCDH